MVTVATALRDYETDGVPASGAHKVAKSDLRSVLGDFETFRNLTLQSGALVYASRSSLFSDLSHDANTQAWVIGDSTIAFNGIYMKVGASGVGSWTRVAELPFSFVNAQDSGAGTPNAILATSSLPISDRTLVAFIANDTTTASPVTIAFNGSASPLTIKTVAGGDVAAGGILAGQAVIGLVMGSVFRLFTDLTSAAIQAAAEAAKEAAEAARDLAIDAADQAAIEGAGDVPTYASRALAEAATIPTARTYIWVAGYATRGDGGHALYNKVASEPTDHEAYFASADGAFWELVGKVHPAEVFGVVDGGDALANSAAFNAAMGYFEYRGGGRLDVYPGSYTIGDNSTSGTCIRARSNVTIFCYPGVTFINKSLGYSNPCKAAGPARALASQATLFQIDGYYDGAITGFKLLGWPVIDNDTNMAGPRGINIFGEIYDCEFTFTFKDFYQTTSPMVWGDQVWGRISRGDRNRLSIRNIKNANAGAESDLLPMGVHDDGRPGGGTMELFACDVDVTRGDTTTDTNHPDGCIKLNAFSNLVFSGNNRFRGGRIGCVNVGTGTQNLSGTLDCGDSLVGLLHTNATNFICHPYTRGADVTVFMSGQIGINVLSAVVSQGPSKNSKYVLQSQNGGWTGVRSNHDRITLSGVTLPTADTVTFTGGGSPNVVWTAHGFTSADLGACIKFTTTGQLPTRPGTDIATLLSDVQVGEWVYLRSIVDANTITVTKSLPLLWPNTPNSPPDSPPNLPGPVTFDGTQSGTHTAHVIIGTHTPFASSGGVLSFIQGTNDKDNPTAIVVLRTATSGVLAAGQTFTIPGGITGTVATLEKSNEMDGLRVEGSIEYGSVTLQDPGYATDPCRNCFFDLTIDGRQHTTASVCNLGSSNWYFKRSTFRLKYINPPGTPVINFGRNNRFIVESDGSSPNVVDSQLFREVGTGSVVDLMIGPNNTTHDFLYQINTGGSKLSLGRLAAPSAIKRRCLVTGTDITRTRRAPLRAEFDLSGAATTTALLSINNPLLVSSIQVIYPAGTTSNTGVAVEVGVLTDTDAVWNITSATSQSAGAVVDYTQTGGVASTMKEPLLTSGVLCVRCAGGKTGADKIVVLVHVADVMPVT